MTELRTIVVNLLRLLAAVVLFLAGLAVVCAAAFVGADRLAGRAELAHRKLQKRIGGHLEAS